MGKNKLKKFDDLQGYPHVFQYPFSALQEKGFEMQGKWGKQFFKNENPIVLELGCGKGEYAVGLAKRYPQKNFIGIDIKGARMWSGAKQALEEGINNVAFLRTNIELIDRFFAKDEVSEIWITFPDPQMKKVRKRLTSTRFMQLYQNILSPEGLIHLKSDSPFMYTYTCEMVKANGYPVQVSTDDLYHSGITDDILEIKTSDFKIFQIHFFSVCPCCCNCNRSRLFFQHSGKPCSTVHADDCAWVYFRNFNIL